MTSFIIGLAATIVTAYGVFFVTERNTEDETYEYSFDY